MVDLHAKLYRDASTDDVKTLRAVTFESEAHHIHNVDEKERQAEDNGCQDLDFKRVRKVQARGYYGSRPY